MKNNKLEVYKESIFVKIHNFIKRIFCRKKVSVEEKNNELEKISATSNNTFFENIQIKENSEEIKIKNLKEQYDNGQIDEDDLSEEEIEKIIALYKNETERLNTDTEIRKNHISQMLKELKHS